MGLNVGNLPVKQVFVGSTPVTAVYVGAEKIWPTTTEVVQLTLGTGTQARDQLLAALTARGLDYQTVEEIPFDIELVGSGSAWDMFSGCAALTHVPDLDTGQVTNMEGMFFDCPSLTTVPALDATQVTNMSYMFYNCAALTTLPDLDTGQVTDMEGMFYDCAALTDGNVRLIGKHPSVSTTDMITGSGLTRLPFFDAAGNPI